MLSWSQEVTFLFTVAAPLTDISVQLNKGRDHIKYFTTPKQWTPLSLVPHLRGLEHKHSDALIVDLIIAVATK